MNHDFPPHYQLYNGHVETLKERYIAAMEACDVDVLVVEAGEVIGVPYDDNYFDFRADWLFNQWLPGDDLPGSRLIITRSGEVVLAVIFTQTYWEQQAHVPDGPYQTVLNARVFGSSQEIDAFVDKTWGEDQVSVRSPEHPSILRDLTYAAGIKTPWELENLREACARAWAGHYAVAQAWQNGSTELECYTHYLAAIGGTERDMGYSPIIATNHNAAVLHYRGRERFNMQDNLSLLIDAGASYHGYHSDISRTHASSGAHDIYRHLVDGMVQLQASLRDLMVAGASWSDCDSISLIKVAQLLHDAGVLRWSSEDAVVRQLAHAFYPHGLGHLLGTRTHDHGGYLRADGTEVPPPASRHYLRCTRILEPGMVLTLEPGCYFIESLLEPWRIQHPDACDWALVDLLAHHGGIRVEDDIAVTSHAKPDVLSAEVTG